MPLPFIVSSNFVAVQHPAVFSAHLTTFINIHNNKNDNHGFANMMSGPAAQNTYHIPLVPLSLALVPCHLALKWRRTLCTPAATMPCVETFKIITIIEIIVINCVLLQLGGNVNTTIRCPLKGWSTFVLARNCESQRSVLCWWWWLCTKRANQQTNKRRRCGWRQGGRGRVSWDRSGDKKLKWIQEGEYRPDDVAIAIQATLVGWSVGMLPFGGAVHTKSIWSKWVWRRRRRDKQMFLFVHVWNN